VEKKQTDVKGRACAAQKAPLHQLFHFFLIKNVKVTFTDRLSTYNNNDRYTSP